MLLLQEKDVCVPLLTTATEEGQKVQPHVTTSSRKVTGLFSALLLSFSSTLLFLNVESIL
jgi:hypothetical protein